MSAELAASLRISLLRLSRQMRLQRVDGSITLSHLSAMSTLDLAGPMSPGELANQERVQPPSMTKIVSRLVALGLVARSPHPTDGRQAVVSLTEAGRAMLHDEREARDAWLSTRLAQLSEDERSLLWEVRPLLERIASS